VLTAEGIAHFKTFGYILRRQVFDSDEMETFVSAAEDLWSQAPNPEDHKERRLNFFVERNTTLTKIISDDRIYPVLETPRNGRKYGYLCNR
jgi:hypothetical protein